MRAFRVTLWGPVFPLSFSSTSFHILQTILDPLALPIPFTATNSFPLPFPFLPFSHCSQHFHPPLHNFPLSCQHAIVFLLLPIFHPCFSFSFFPSLLPHAPPSFSPSLLLPSLRTQIWSRVHAPLLRNAPTPKAAGSSLGRTALEPQPPRSA